MSTLSTCLSAFALALASALPSAPRDAETDAWNAAMALETAGKHAEGVAAFESFLAAYPDSPRVPLCQIQCGVSWFGVARSRQVLHRCPPPAVEAFAHAYSYFALVADGRPDHPLAARARYMCASTHLFLGELDAAEVDYGIVIDRYAVDAKYYPKSLERRAMVRRNLLKSASAIEDLRTYQKAAPSGEDAKIVEHALRAAALLDHAAPPLDPEAWAQGDPRGLDAHLGQVVGIYFFGSTCPNCAKEREFMADLVRRDEPRGLQMIGVVNHIDHETVATAAQYCKKYAIGYPVIMDHGRTVPAYAADTMPYLVLIDREGKVRWMDHPANLVEETLDALLDDTAVKSKVPASAAGH